MEGWASKLKHIDAFPKVNEDFYQRTLSGGIITVGSTLLMIGLFLSELSENLALLVDQSFTDQKAYRQTSDACRSISARQHGK